MKNRFLNFVIATAFAAVIANPPAVAQDRHTATIPFSFTAGGTEYAGGTYEITPMGQNSVLKLTSVETLKSHVVTAPIPIDNKPGTSPKLVFQVTGDGYRLSEVWLQGGHGMKTFNSRKSNDAASVSVPIR